MQQLQPGRTYSKAGMLLLFLRGSKRFFLSAMAASFLVAALDMIPPQIIRIVVDYCLDNNSENLPAVILSGLERLGGREFVRTHLHYAALIILGTAVLTAIFKYLNTYLSAKGMETLMKTTRDLLFYHVQRLPYAWHMKNQTGDIIQRCTSDVNIVREFVAEQLMQVVRIAIMILLGIFCMASMSSTLVWVAILSIPIIVSYSLFFYRRVGHMFLQCDENEGVLSTITQENLTGVRVVRAFGRENYERERFNKQNTIYTDTWMKLCRLLAGFWASGDVMTGLQIMLIVVLGTVLCVNGEMTSGELIAFISYNARIVWPIRRLGRMLSEMSKAGVSLGRLQYILNSATEDMRQEEMPPMTGDIVFDHVSFAYEPEHPVLTEINLTIRGGSTIGILGGTGSGKTTLMQLLNRLYELQEGSITIDGVPVEKIGLPYLRSHIGMVLQEPFLFSRTIRENLTIAAPGVSDEALERAVTVASLEKTIGHFASGYETMVGEWGVTLSGGQKQRTAIARMLLQKTPIMVFDDSLSAVDAETDEKIRRALASYAGEATIILISHRISTLMQADDIIVLEKGRITQQGTHEELSSQPGLYRRICEIQQGGDEPADGEAEGGMPARETGEAMSAPESGEALQGKEAAYGPECE